MARARSLGGGLNVYGPGRRLVQVSVAVAEARVLAPQHPIDFEQVAHVGGQNGRVEEPADGYSPKK